MISLGPHPTAAMITWRIQRPRGSRSSGVIVPHEIERRAIMVQLIPDIAHWSGRATFPDVVFLLAGLILL